MSTAETHQNSATIHEPSSGRPIPSAYPFRSVLVAVSSSDAIEPAKQIATVLVGHPIANDGVADIGNKSVLHNGSVLILAESDPDAGVVRTICATNALECIVLSMDRQVSPTRLLNVCLAESVFRSTDRPCIVIGPSVPKHPFRLAPGPVLFATNFQEPKMKTIQLAHRLALLFRRELECLHVLPVDLAPAAGAKQIVPEVMRRALVRGAAEYGLELREQAAHILYGTSVSSAVAGYAAECNACMIVLPLARAEGCGRHLTPGITTTLIGRAPCPVITSISKTSES